MCRRIDKYYLCWTVAGFLNLFRNMSTIIKCNYYSILSSTIILKKTKRYCFKLCNYLPFLDFNFTNLSLMQRKLITESKRLYVSNISRTMTSFRASPLLYWHFTRPCDFGAIYVRPNSMHVQKMTNEISLKIGDLLYKFPDNEFKN